MTNENPGGNNNNTISRPTNRLTNYIIRLNAPNNNSSVSHDFDVRAGVSYTFSLKKGF